MQYVGKQLPYDDIGELRQRMADVAPHLAKNDTVESPMWLNGEYFKVIPPADMAFCTGMRLQAKCCQVYVHQVCSIMTVFDVLTIDICAIFVNPCVV